MCKVHDQEDTGARWGVGARQGGYKCKIGSGCKTRRIEVQNGEWMHDQENTSARWGVGP